MLVESKALLMVDKLAQMTVGWMVERLVEVKAGLRVASRAVL